MASGAVAQRILRSLHDALLGWYAAYGRDLPWRRTRDAYAIWVSEIMLQQTRVDTVTRSYERFVDRFPTVLALAEARQDDVLALWSGLGYYRRARLLHEGARAVVGLGGALPENRRALRSLPGIGPYTAGAIASIAFGEAVGLVDGNVARVLSRLFEIEEDMRTKGMRTAKSVADRIVAARDPGGWNQALMELGSVVCMPHKPACSKCPLTRHCRAHRAARTSELPFLSAKKKPVTRRLVSLVMERDDGAILLVRREADRMFGGLWEPPSSDESASAQKSLAVTFGANRLERAGVIEHVLSHRKLLVDVFYTRVPRGLRAPRRGVLPEGYDRARFVEPRDFGKWGIATFARKILACVPQRP